MLTNDEADLFNGNSVSLWRIIDHFEGDEDVGAVVFDLGALAGVDNVLLGEGVDAVEVAQAAHDFYVVDGVDINPGGGLAVVIARTVLDIRQSLDLNAGVGVLAVGGNSAVTGNSGMYVNATAPTASATRPVHVVGYVKRPDNEAPGAYNKLLVQLTTSAQGNAIVGV